MLDIPHNGYAKNRKGEKVGPIQRVSCSKTTDKKGFYYACAGESWYTHGRNIDNGTEKSIDLVARWQDGPVVTETVTKTRIVPGTYGRLAVNLTYATEPSVGIKLVDRNGKELGVDGAGMTADELDAAAAVLSALAKGLRDA